MHVVIIGPGRLGRSMSLLLSAAGHTVSVVGRGADVPAGDVIWLTVPDRSISHVAGALQGPTPVLHASGARGLEDLVHLPEHGSLHPLMTFPGPEVALPDLQGVPAAVDGTPAARAIAAHIAVDLGMTPLVVPGDRRLYHAAAVVAGNLSTVLLAEGERILRAAGLEHGGRLLLPLALASLRNAADDPAAALTGPVARGDTAVLDAHRLALTAAHLEDTRAWYDQMVRFAADLATQRGLVSNE